jgi:hypothetical protein
MTTPNSATPQERTKMTAREKVLAVHGAANYDPYLRGAYSTRPNYGMRLSDLGMEESAAWEAAAQHPSVAGASANIISEVREDLDGRTCQVCGASFIRGQEKCLSCGTKWEPVAGADSRPVQVAVPEEEWCDEEFEIDGRKLKCSLHKGHTLTRHIHIGDHIVLAEPRVRDAGKPAEPLCRCASLPKCACGGNAELQVRSYEPRYRVKCSLCSTMTKPCYTAEQAEASWAEIGTCAAQPTPSEGAAPLFCKHGVNTRTLTCMNCEAEASAPNESGQPIVATSAVPLPPIPDVRCVSCASSYAQHDVTWARQCLRELSIRIFLATATQPVSVGSHLPQVAALREAIERGINDSFRFGPLTFDGIMKRMDDLLDKWSASAEPPQGHTSWAEYRAARIADLEAENATLKARIEGLEAQPDKEEVLRARHIYEQGLYGNQAVKNDLSDVLRDFTNRRVLPSAPKDGGL